MKHTRAILAQFLTLTARRTMWLVLYFGAFAAMEALGRGVR